MYITLLATAMDTETVKFAHPSYCQIIQQLSPDEARIMSLIKEETGFAAVIVRKHYGSGLFEDPMGYYGRLCLKSGCATDELEEFYITNLARLGMFSLRMDQTVTNDKAYQDVIESKIIQAKIAEVSEGGKFMVAPHRCLIAVTEYARQFYRACIQDDATVDNKS